MKTFHKIYYDSIQNCDIPSEGVDLIVTSPPYPMVEMWDNQFIESYPPLDAILNHQKDGELAHTLMLRTMFPIWDTCERILKTGGFLCVNIGDATRSINGSFKLYDNHSSITKYLEHFGLEQLPRIIWRKQTNAPNKFMGSGTLPLRAYVTLEHEFILIFRKGRKVNISPKREKARKKSSIFWEERNKWFSDIWEFKGAKQLKNGKRTAAFPFELPHRLINMFSVQGDIVVDPFLGSGTTMAAAIVNARNSIGFEIETELKPTIIESLLDAKIRAAKIPITRITEHKKIIKSLNCKYLSKYGKVKTKQEIEIKIPTLRKFKVVKENNYACEHGSYR